MVFLEVTSASLPDTPTLRMRPAANVQIIRDGVAQFDDPISFTASSGTEDEAEEISENIVEDQDEDDEDSIFL